MPISAWATGRLAINDFNTYLVLRPGIIDSYVYERIGDAYLALGQPQPSLDAYTKAASATREASSLAALRERVAAGYLNTGQPLAGRRTVRRDPRLCGKQLLPRQHRLSGRAGAARLGRHRGRLHTLAAHRERLPGQRQAYQALGTLLGAELQIDSYQQGRIYYYNEDYNAAIQALNAYTSETGVASPRC